MRKTVEKLHEKSEKTRKRIALGVSLAVTLAIFLVWFSITNITFFQNSAVVRGQLGEEQEGKSQAASPLASLRDDVVRVGEGLELFIEGFIAKERSADVEVVDGEAEFPGVMKNDIRLPVDRDAF